MEVEVQTWIEVVCDEETGGALTLRIRNKDHGAILLELRRPLNGYVRWDGNDHLHDIGPVTIIGVLIHDAEMEGAAQPIPSTKG